MIKPNISENRMQGVRQREYAEADEAYRLPQREKPKFWQLKEKKKLRFARTVETADDELVKYWGELNRPDRKSYGFLKKIDYIPTQDLQGVGESLVSRRNEVIQYAMNHRLRDEPSYQAYTRHSISVEKQINEELARRKSMRDN